jgi:hypothetical protein
MTLRHDTCRVKYCMTDLTDKICNSQPLTEMSTKNLFVGKRRPERKADNLTAIYEPIV